MLVVTVVLLMQRDAITRRWMMEDDGRQKLRKTETVRNSLWLTSSSPTPVQTCSKYTSVDSTMRSSDGTWQWEQCIVPTLFLPAMQHFACLGAR